MFLSGQFRKVRGWVDITPWYSTEEVDLEQRPSAELTDESPALGGGSIDTARIENPARLRIQSRGQATWQVDAFSYDVFLYVRPDVH
jgi:hypothetical protein